MSEYAERLLAARSQVYSSPEQPIASEPMEEGGCGVTGFACTVPVGGRFIYEPSVQMQNRGNGKGGGIAAAGLVPEQLGISDEVLQSHYLLQIALLDPDCHAELEREFILPNFEIAVSTRQPHVDDYRDIPGLEVPDRTIARGIALNPGTPVDVVDPFLEDLEMVVLVAINPGWGGQAFIPATLGRIEAVRRKIAAAGRDILIAVDGGITRRNIGQLAGRGVDVVVTGSAVFDGDVKTNIEEMTRALRNPLVEPRGLPSTGSGQAAPGGAEGR